MAAEPTAERVAEIRAAIGNMGARRASKQGDLSSAMCRLSLPMIRDLLAAYDAATAERDREREHHEFYRVKVGELLAAESEKHETIKSLRSQLAECERQRDDLRAKLDDEDRGTGDFVRHCEREARNQLRADLRASGHLREPLAWTTSPPTSPGAYWWRDRSPGAAWSGPLTLTIYADTRSGRRGLFTAGDEVASIGGQWAGPIPPPVEPVDAQPLKGETP